MNEINQVRGEIIARRTYHRFRDDGRQETWSEVIERVIQHSLWLEQRTGLCSPPEEFAELRQLFLAKKAFCAGRTLWLGGTETARKRAACNFNCAFTHIETVYDFVDAFWLLLQGCGVGAKMVTGTLTGFKTHIPTLEIVPSTRADKSGVESNYENFGEGVWYLQVGDSAMAWAKLVGKLLSGKREVTKLIIDFSQVRPPGDRLKGYGWICEGYRPLAQAIEAIFAILNKAAGRELSSIDMLDIFNHLGTTLSSRRSAEIILADFDNPRLEEFVHAKDDVNGMSHRAQSNNSVVFQEYPGDIVLRNFLENIMETGKGEPGLINGEAAKLRAPWFAGVNPCSEILLADKGFCNLHELVLPSFVTFAEVERAAWLLGRNNYRQTLVDLRDGILQDAWDKNNRELRLCGVGLTGIQMAPQFASNYQLARLRRAAQAGAYSMAQEAGRSLPANVTTIKPSGTLSKVAGVSEGMHFPIAPYLINWVNFSKSDSLCEKLRKAGYNIKDNPYDDKACLVALPVSFVGARGFSSTISAYGQLDEYKRLMTHYCDQNVSATIYYHPSELEAIVSWLSENWLDYVGVSFLPLDGGTKDYKYRPQEIVTASAWKDYVSTLKQVKWADGDAILQTEESISDCEGGVCPVR